MTCTIYILAPFTNGTLISPEWFEFLKKNNIHIALSVYSYEAELHDKITGCNGSWEKTNKTIKELKNYEIPYRVCNVLMRGQVLGVVTDRYKIVQNEEAFAFTDELLGEGVRYETAGSLQGGRKVWLLAHLPHEYIISGERISPYLVFFNSHDGSGAIKVAITPIRVVCQNTLNLALSTAKRSWSMIHTGDIKGKMQEAKDTLFMAEKYMDSLGKEFETLRKKKLTDQQVLEYIEILLPLEEDSTPQQIRNMKRLREDMKMRYFDAPDLKDVGKNAYAFVNAVSDF